MEGLQPHTVGGRQGGLRQGPGGGRLQLLPWDRPAAGGTCKPQLARLCGRGGDKTHRCSRGTRGDHCERHTAQEHPPGLTGGYQHKHRKSEER